MMDFMFLIIFQRLILILGWVITQNVINLLFMVFPCFSTKTFEFASIHTFYLCCNFWNELSVSFFLTSSTYWLMIFYLKKVVYNKLWWLACMIFCTNPEIHVLIFSSAMYKMWCDVSCHWGCRWWNFTILSFSIVWDHGLWSAIETRDGLLGHNPYLVNKIWFYEHFGSFSLYNLLFQTELIIQFSALGSIDLNCRCIHNQSEAWFHFFLGCDDFPAPIDLKQTPLANNDSIANNLDEHWKSSYCITFFLLSIHLGF